LDIDEKTSNKNCRVTPALFAVITGDDVGTRGATGESVSPLQIQKENSICMCGASRYALIHGCVLATSSLF
jgi:hypothetical protein